MSTGQRIVQASTGNLKRVTLELGGKSPNVVFADADPDQVRTGALWGIFYNMGQDCSAGSRLFVDAKIGTTGWSRTLSRTRRRSRLAREFKRAHSSARW